MGNIGSVTSGTGTAKISQDPDLQALFKNLLGETGPARKLQFQQLTEALSTGGVGARIPIIQRAVEAQMAADKQSATQGREATARAGIAGSPFDVANQQVQDTAAKSREASIGPAIAAQMVAGAPQQIDSATNQAMNLGSLNQSREEWNSKVMGDFLSNLRASTSLSTGSVTGGDSSPTAVTYGSPTTGSGSSIPQGGEMLTPGGSPETSAVSGGASSGGSWWSSLFA